MMFEHSHTSFYVDICFQFSRVWHPTPVLLPGKSHGWRSLVGCSPWGCEELDTTEQLHFHFSLSCIGEGNGNPLQRSCPENPRDGGSWWAAVYGVAQSRTWLKWLSSNQMGSEILHSNNVVQCLLILAPHFNRKMLVTFFLSISKSSCIQGT